MTFIERVGQKRVGFWCWKLFIINYFRCYEVKQLFIFFFYSHNNNLKFLTDYLNYIYSFPENDGNILKNDLVSDIISYKYINNIIQ